MISKKELSIHRSEVPTHTWKACGEVEVYIHLFLKCVLNAYEWSFSHPGCFLPRERSPGIHSVGCWVGPRANLDKLEKEKSLTPAES
jgi:hypothetical protein